MSVGNLAGMDADITGPNRHIVMAIAGYARTGKDTLANAIFDKSEDRRPEYFVLVTKFANALKQSLQEAFNEAGVDVDVFTEDPAEKEKLRPLLVAYGEYARSKDKDVWVNMALEEIESFTETADEGYSLSIVADMRYANEYDRIEKECASRGWVFVPIYIGRVGKGPANAEETRSFHEMLDTGTRFSTVNSHYLIFEEGDVNGIAGFAARFVNELGTYHSQ